MFAHLKTLIFTIGLDRGGFMGPLDMTQEGLLLCSSALRAIMVDDVKPSPPLINLLDKISENCFIPALETNCNMFFMSDYFGERPHISDFLLERMIEIFASPFDQTKIDKEDSMILFYQSRVGLESPMQSLDKWIPKAAELPEGGVGLTGTSEGLVPSQLLVFKGCLVRPSEWGGVRMGYLRDVPITRKNIIDYVANKLGGVHYDSRRRPRPEDRKAFLVLEEAYDWNDEAVVHAGLVCMGLLATEIMLSRQVRNLLPALADYLGQRDGRLRKRDALDDQDWL